MKKKPISISKLLPLLSIFTVALLWELITIILDLPVYILPRFSDVIIELISNFSLLMHHAFYTVSEAIVGLLISIIISFMTALVLDRNRHVKNFIYPIIAISQTIPLMAIAPLFVIWFGFTFFAKILVVILVCYFPITINILTGFEEIDREEIDLFKVMKSSTKDLYLKLKIPSAIPYFFSGLKIATTYAILAALIAEFMGGKDGLGLYIETARRSYSVTSVFAIIIVIIVATLILLLIIQLLEKMIVKYKGEIQK